MCCRCCFSWWVRDFDYCKFDYCKYCWMDCYCHGHRCYGILLKRRLSDSFWSQNQYQLKEHCAGKSLSESVRKSNCNKNASNGSYALKMPWYALPTSVWISTISPVTHSLLKESSFVSAHLERIDFSLATLSLVLWGSEWSSNCPGVKRAGGNWHVWKSTLFLTIQRVQDLNPSLVSSLSPVNWSLDLAVFSLSSSPFSTSRLFSLSS